MFIKGVVLLSVVGIISCIPARDYQLNTGIGSTQSISGSRNPGTQVDLDPTGTSSQTHNGHPNHPGTSSSGSQKGQPSIHVNGEDFTGQTVNRPGLQINHTPGKTQFI